MTHDEVKYLRDEIKRFKDKTPGERFWEFCMKLAVPVSILVAGFVINLSERVAKMEDNRFTAADGARLESALREWTRLEFPPNLLMSQVNQIQEQTSKIPAIQISLEDLKQRVQRLEGR